MYSLLFNLFACTYLWGLYFQYMLSYTMQIHTVHEVGEDIHVTYTRCIYLFTSYKNCKWSANIKMTIK